MNNNDRCPHAGNCGGCLFRSLPYSEYRRRKEDSLKRILAPLALTEKQWQEPVFIPDGTRRRASLAFRFHKGKLLLGFNEKQSGNIVDIASCCLLTPRLNRNLDNIRNLLKALCGVDFTAKQGKKNISARITGGDVWLTDAANGIDMVLEFAAEPVLEHRLIISEMLAQMPDIIRVSHRRRTDTLLETLLEKSRPFIDIAGYQVFIPAGTFLQPSAEGEKALLSLVMKYTAGFRGKIADLFCGVGTFSYPLSRLAGNKICAVDSSKELLDGFRRSVNKNQIANIEIIQKNLFKYPLDAQELSGMGMVVVDPPRAGAAAQMRQLATLDGKHGLQKIISVSCNPRSFAADAQILQSGGWKLQELTMVDQFVYSDHSELVALFTKNNCQAIL